MIQEKTETKLFPLLPLRGIVVFPYVIVNLDVGREKSVAALEEAMAHDHKIMLTTQKDSTVDDPGADDFYKIGTIVQIRQLLKLPGGSVRVLVEGLHRARIKKVITQGKFYAVEVVEYIKQQSKDTSIEMQALIRTVTHQFEDWVKLSKKIPPEALVSVVMIEDGGHLCDLIAGHINMKFEDKQELLSLIDPVKRLEKLYAVLTREIEILGIEKKIGERVRSQMEKIQKDYYLREQMKAIEKELGDTDGKTGEINGYRQQMKKGNYPQNVLDCLEKELKHMEKLPANSSETGVIRTYIEWLLALPWQDVTRDKLSITSAEKMLNKEHYGLKKVKERILEYLAVRKLSENMKAPIICLVGPPGVGKTSLASSVAKTMGRKFIRASLGGIRDEAEIRGHRRTYIGALPGRIINGIRNVDTKNPVFLLDEIDKIASDFRGDPTSALLEVLDPEQNNSFSDHYIEIPFDLSQVLWIVTANDIGNIPRPLLDRMEVISLPSYTEEEKYQIAHRYLVKKELHANGLTRMQLQFGAGALQKIIADYTLEAGVRELERQIGKICRKAAKKIVEGETKKIRVTSKNLADFLGREKYIHTRSEPEPQVGLCTGLAWTQAGGVILPTEVSVLPGKGHLILTGQLGDVMKESAQTGLSYIRSLTHELNLAPDFYEKKDIHIHVPEGAIPKDGPSAGITMTTAMISALTNKKVRSDIAMTGEITLRGRVLPIGGLKEKSLAAYREKIYNIIIPKENERDLEEIDSNVREKIHFLPVEKMTEILKYALVNK